MSQSIIFDGVNSLSSDTLIRLIRLRSLDAGKERDDGWIAITASACFEGEALHWYEAQTEQIQDSWKLLRRALLLRWPPQPSPGTMAHRSTDSLPLVSGSIPTPAAAPPSSPSAGPSIQSPNRPFSASSSPRSGRIRMENRMGGLLGYLCRPTPNGFDYVYTRERAKAAVVSFVPGRDRHEMTIANSPTDGVGIACKSSSLPTVNQKLANGELVRMRLQALRRAQAGSSWVCDSTDNKGGINATIWTVLMDGAIAIFWEALKPRACYPLDLAVIVQSPDKSKVGRIYLTNNFNEMVGSPMVANAKWNLAQVDFYFEPL